MMGFFDKVKNAVGSKNFKYLDDLIHSGQKEIVLDSDIVLGWREEKKYLDGIKLDVDDLIIDGNGHIIDAQGKTSIFFCTGKNITIKNITLKNGFAEYGGAIKNGGELTITGSILTGNTVQGKCSEGGAIRNRGSLTIIESTLTENTSEWSGGAIRNRGSLTIIESTLTGNTAKDGGAIYNYDGGELTISKSTLTGNTAQKDGGAIYNYDDGELTITFSTLNNNTAEHEGGAIFNHDGMILIETDYGGILNISGCKILNNKSPNNIIFNKFFMEVHNTKFNNNQSKHVLVNEYSEFNISIIDSEFIGNNVEKDVIFNNGKSCTIKNTIFEDNLSRNITNKTDLTLISSKIKDDGQSILNDGHILIRQSQNLEDKIYGEGTVETDVIPQEETFDFGYLDKKIHESKSKEIILDQDITFENYEIDYYEGGIELDMDDLVIDGNGHTIDGANKSRIFIVTGKNITLKNITFKNGVTHDNYHYHFNDSGGAIRINHNDKITIENCKFISNTAQSNGGAIFSRDCELTVTESTLNNNTANNGGAIHKRDGKLTITKSTLTGNTAQGEYGGGGAIDGLDCEITVTESMLNNNTAKRDGGAIDNGKIYNNSAELTIHDSTLQENTSILGGAIQNRGCKLTITESTLNNNTASDGGAIYNEGGVLTITISTLTGNTTENSRPLGGGGAIFNKYGKLTITESTFTRNTSQGTRQSNGGGAINNYDGELTITLSTLNNNTAEHEGGAIRNNGSLTITESTLTKNTALRGGAIHLYIGGYKYESENCTFKDNEPDDVYK